MFLHQEQVQTQHDRDNGRQHGHVNAIKARQRCPRYIISRRAAAGEEKSQR